MRKLLLLAVTATAFLTVRAGGLMITRITIAFDRMMARGATFDIDATFSNPAGLGMGARRMGTLAQLPETVATYRHQTR